jgi:uncharacterized protein YjbJ (UPF0337 family)
MSDAKNDQVKGRAKETLGAATDDDELRREGRDDQRAGKAKEGVDKASDKVKDVVDKVRDRMK